MTEFRTPIQAGSSAKYSLALTGVLAAQVSDILLTIVDASENVIAGVDELSVKNTNGGTVTDGLFELVLAPTWTIESPGDPSQVQARYLHLDITLVGGAERVHEVLWYVQGNHVPGYD